MSPRPQLPLSQAVLGLTLFARIALPLTRDGYSLLDMFLQIVARNPVGGLTFLIMFASPQLFGLAVALAGVVRDERRALLGVQLPLAILQGMTFLVGISMVGNTRVLAPWALLGFALISSGYYLYATGEAAASTRGGLSLRWHVRWGALLIAGLGGWIRMQAHAGLHLGIALDVALISAVALLAATARREPRPVLQDM